MTKEQKANKQKAIEIANKEKKYYGNPQYEMRDENWSVHECFKSAIQAMDWKDEQEIEFLQSLIFQASTQQALNIIINNRIKLLKGK